MDPRVVVRGGVNDAPAALACSTWGGRKKNAAVRGSRVVVSVVPACLIRKATKSILSQYLLRAAIRGD